MIVTNKSIVVIRKGETMMLNTSTDLTADQGPEGELSLLAYVSLLTCGELFVLCASADITMTLL